MSDNLIYQLLADAVLVLHVVVVVFVVGGFILIIVGNLLKWQWVNVFWFRVLHLLAISVVIMGSWLGAVCPLTVVEMWLRSEAHEVTYSGGFIQHWLQQLLYFNAPHWVFSLAYTSFGLMVLVEWWCFPPRIRRRK